jgi:hypothetical protein
MTMSAPDEAGDPAPQDRFYRGVITKLYRGREEGVVRSVNGRETPFVFLHVTMVGAVRKFEDLHEGMAVGFDVGWTSSGLRVTVISTD